MIRPFRTGLPAMLVAALLAFGCSDPGVNRPDAGPDAGPTDDGGVTDDGGPGDDGGDPNEDRAQLCEACIATSDCSPEHECVDLGEGVKACLLPCNPTAPECPDNFECDMLEGSTSAVCVPVDDVCCVGETEESYGQGVHCERPDCGEIPEGTEIACGQGICAATFLACVDGEPQKCVPGQPLRDGDGNPIELCNGLDDDCNGVVDDLPPLTCGLGICERTVAACVDGEEQECLPGEPLRDDEGNPLEVCNGLDDDCNGVVDDLPALNCGVGECARTVPACREAPEGDDWDNVCVPGQPADEVCNGLDDNCNGQADDGLGTLSCGTGECAREVPACVDGQQQECVAGEPVEEVCDGRDNNCSGQVDDMGELNCGVGACAVTVVACNNGNTQTCIPNDPTPEVCNGIDDDCNGLVDDGLGTISCGTGRCARTVDACKDGVSQACTPGEPLKDQDGKTYETCNGVDDNCDGTVDNNPVDAGGNCDTGNPGECAGGTTVCTNGRLVCQQNNQPRPEVCNGKDDSCSGAIDDEPTDAGASCTVSGAKGVCAQGMTVCGSGSLSCQSIKAPEPEVCNGLDDDCNGLVDDLPQLTCGIGECRRTVSACVNGQNNTCVPGSPTAEKCDGKDNNCNGLVDDNPTDLASSCSVSGAKGECAQGWQECRNGAKVCVGPEPTAEVCDGKDNNCDGAVNNTDLNGEACHTGKLGICSAGLLSCGTTATSMSCVQQLQPRAETCNGLDDNCDGQKDNAAHIQLCPNSSPTTLKECVGKGTDSAECRHSTCGTRLYDLDDDPGNGCECQDDTSSATCSGAAVIGTLSKNQAVSHTGTMPLIGMTDWFRINWTEQCNGTTSWMEPSTQACGTSSFSAPCTARATYQRCVTDGLPRVTVNSGFRVEIRSSCGATPVCGSTVHNIWEMRDNFSNSTSGFRTRAFAPGGTHSNRLGSLWVRVVRTTGGERSCNEYELTVSR